MAAECGTPVLAADNRSAGSSWAGFQALAFPPKSQDGFLRLVQNFILGPPKWYFWETPTLWVSEDEGSLPGGPYNGHESKATSEGIPKTRGPFSIIRVTISCGLHWDPKP